MKYTKYFATITKNEGRLNVGTYQFQRMMNIIHIEGVIEGMNKIKATLNENEAYKYDMMIFKQNMQLSNLTGNLEPKLLLQEMIQLSE